MADKLQAEITLIRRSGLFLSSWYLSQHPELRGEDGVAHFCTAGWRAGARPNPYFDPVWYLARYGDVAAAEVNPLLHYLALGEREGRDPSACFQARWYRETYHLGPEESPLKHFLERRLTGQVNPVPVFDAAYYLDANPDVAADGGDPFEHFLIFGQKEGRNPAADFDINFYASRYGEFLRGQNPLLHYLANRESGGFLTQRPAAQGFAPGAVHQATRPSPFFEEVLPVPAHAPRRAKLLAYYLPQFHAVPENDLWWGKGFTDWTNLGRAQPRFTGHLQPRIPRDLGYYSLDDPATLRRQIALAKGAGIFGFVFYTYWFNGRRLLEKPLEQLLADKSLDFPFCAMWANENWTRRWDGLEREILIAQEYLESDDAALVAQFARLFADARYIRIAGRPLLMIYRVTLIPDAASRIAKWREMFLDQHGEAPLLVMAQSLGDVAPEPYGLDGAVEFPPHKLSQETPRINATLDLLDPDFSATVHDYAALAKTSLDLPVPEYPLIKTLVPGWDNDPRREGKGLVLAHATPAAYQEWLEKLVAYAAKHPFQGERLICVNAWNEWAEGAFLEPDIHFGAAFLNATGRAICGLGHGMPAAGMLLVGHDAEPHGAQMLLLHLARFFKRQYGIRVHILLLGVGPLLPEYHATAPVSVAYDKAIIGTLLEGFARAGIRAALVNSAASARVVPWAEALGIRTTLLVHEMPQLMQEYNLEIQARLAGAAGTRLVFAAPAVASAFFKAVALPETPASILPQGNYQNIRFNSAARARTRAALGLGDHDFLIMGAGFGHIRKGFDLFLQLARKAAAARQDVHFIWVGGIQSLLKTYLEPEMKAAARFTHVPHTQNILDYFSAADVFALTSREDPYPTVVLEALACGVPCVAFEGSGGIPELLRETSSGGIARMADVEGFWAEVARLLDHRKLDRERPQRAAMAAKKFDFAAYADALLALALPELRRVSVAVLSYNYEKYLPGRLNSIFQQTYPGAEILLLDDASTDKSVKIAVELAAAAGRNLTVLQNPQNSGSVFAQWRRAAQAATGEFLWMCEADDAADEKFLARLMAAMENAPDALLGFTDSRAVDGDGRTVSPSYQTYYLDSGARELTLSGVWDASIFAQKFLARRNLILNVSSVLWRRAALLQALEALPDLEDWRLAGDWRVYLHLLTSQPGRVVVLAEPLNLHRRHAAGVTEGLDANLHLQEIARMHAIAAETLGLDAPARAAQAEYLAQITRQLGAKTPKKLARKRLV